MTSPHPSPRARTAFDRTLRIVTIAVTALLAACAGSGTKLVNALTPTNAYAMTADIAYGEGPRRKLDVYVPVTLAPGAKAPVVVFFYGGSWREGSKSDYRFLGDALASNGIVAVVADYRLFPEVSYPDFLDDTAAAVAWTHREIARFGGDPERLFVAGHSAGAYDAAMIAYDSRWLAKVGMAPSQLRGFVGLAGPYNFLPIQDPGSKEVFHWPDTPTNSQPIHHVAKDSLPALLIAAKKDTFVYPDVNTERFADALKGAGVEVTVDLHGGVNHVTLMGAMARPLRFLAPVEREFTDWVLTH